MARTDADRRPSRPSDRLIGVVWGDDAHRHDVAVARRRRLALRGVVAVSALSALISALHVFAIPPFTPPDETAHIAYALAVTDGEIPLITDFPDPSRLPYMRGGLSVWVANHPPLVYLLLGLPLRAFEAFGAPLVGFYVVRLAIVASAAVGYLLVGWFAVLLLPHRPAAAVVATGVAATVPNSLHVAGMAYTDAPGFATVAALLVTALVVLRRGVTLPRAATLTVLAVLAANTRAVGMAAAAGCIGALGLAVLLHGRGQMWVRLLRGAALAAGSGVVTVLSAVWFYVGYNLARYQSPTGSSALMELHSREPQGGTVLERLVFPPYVRSLAKQYWRRVEADALGDPYVPELMMLIGRWALGLLLVAALLVGLWRLAVGAWRQPVVLALCWAVAIGWFAALYVGMADFVQSGGGSHLRYLWPAVGTVAVVLTTGLTALPRRWGALAGAVLVGYQAVVSLVAAVGLVYRPEIATSHGPAPDVALRALAADAPAAAGAVLVVAGALGLLLLGLWARAAWRLAPDDDRRHLAPDPRGWAIPLGRGTAIRPVDVALATVAGIAGGWLVAYQLEVVVSLPLLAAVVAVAAAVASALASRRAPTSPSRGAAPGDGADRPRSATSTSTQRPPG